MTIQTIKEEVDKLVEVRDGLKELLKTIYGDNRFGHFKEYVSWFNQLAETFKELINGTDTLETITLPLFVNKITKSMFKDKTAIKTIVAKNVTQIEEEAFMNCTNLSKVILGDVKQIPENAFRNCGDIYLGGCDNLVNILSYAFKDCKSVNLSIHTVKIIGDKAFENCGYSSIYLDNDTSIGSSAFAGGSLQDLYAPNLTELSDYCFYNSSGNAYIYAPSLVTLRPYCLSSENLTVQNGNYNISSELENYALYLPNVKQVLHHSFKNLAISGDVNLNNALVIGEEAFANVSFSSFNAKNKIELENIKTIERNAFLNFTGYEGYLNGETVKTKIIIGSNIETIDKTAFKTTDAYFEIHINKPTGSVTGAPWGATNAKVVWNSTGA